MGGIKKKKGLKSGKSSKMMTIKKGKRDYKYLAKWMLNISFIRKPSMLRLGPINFDIFMNNYF